LPHLEFLKLGSDAIALPCAVDVQKATAILPVENDGKGGPRERLQPGAEHLHVLHALELSLQHLDALLHAFSNCPTCFQIDHCERIGHLRVICFLCGWRRPVHVYVTEDEKVVGLMKELGVLPV